MNVPYLCAASLCLLVVGCRRATIPIHANWGGGGRGGHIAKCTRTQLVSMQRLSCWAIDDQFSLISLLPLGCRAIHLFPHMGVCFAQLPVIPEVFIHED